MQGDEILAHRLEVMERGHAEALAPMVADAMAGFSFSDLDRLAVTSGPGTFTGQRVGLAFMRGLRLALNKPLIGVTTLETMAAAAEKETGIFRAAAIHDARRDEAYLSLCEGEDMVLPPTVMPFADGVERIRGFGPCALAGTGAPAASASLGNGFVLSTIRQPDAIWVARLARNRPAPNAAPGPLYLRAPDAKLPA
jgi:tRNA threonylcarbamoyladenosine biosynthesis protein TsaB